MSLTGIPVPKIAIFENVNKVAITAATNQIYNINSKNLNRLVGDFVPIEGLDVLPKGLNVLHYASNSNQDIKNKQNKVNSLMFFSDNRIFASLLFFFYFGWFFCLFSEAISTIIS